jgi:hypothetical protein
LANGPGRCRLRKEKKMISDRVVPPIFHAGDEVVLAYGTYQGTAGVFLRLREDPNWAEIAESNGTVNFHPVAWLAHTSGAVRSAIRATGYVEHHQ